MQLQVGEGRGGLAGGDDVGDQPFAGRVQGDPHGADARVTEEGGFQLRPVDVEPPQPDDAGRLSHQLDGAVGAVAGEEAGPHRRFVGAGHAELAGHADWGGMARPIEH